MSARWLDSADEVAEEIRRIDQTDTYDTATREET